MNLLELFAGSRSIGKAAEKYGINVFSSDIEPFENINYIVNILEFDCSKVPFIPDFVWASPPVLSLVLHQSGIIGIRIILQRQKAQKWV